LKIASWNVNSIRARKERVLAWLERHEPDVLCLQELKVEEKDFPFEELGARGYQVVMAGQRTYNGVGIASRKPLGAVRAGLDDGVDDPQARLIGATVDGVRLLSVYVPNGQAPGSDKFVYKLRWLARLRGYLERHHHPSEPLVVCGDFNVAPEARDVYDPAGLEGDTLFHPEVRQALRHVTDWGLEDTFRRHQDAAGLYSWWDYRLLGFPKNRGFRIDHIFATAAVRSSSSVIDREERKGKQPSDHAPVVTELA
jgi:exodeoxyribonuclease-3